MELSYTKIKVNKLFEPTIKYYGDYIKGERPTIESLKESGYKFGLYVCLADSGADIYYYRSFEETIEHLQNTLKEESEYNSLVWIIIEFDFDCDQEDIDYDDAENYLMYIEGMRTKEGIEYFNKQSLEAIEFNEKCCTKS